MEWRRVSAGTSTLQKVVGHETSTQEKDRLGQMENTQESSRCPLSG